MKFFLIVLTCFFWVINFTNAVDISVTSSSNQDTWYSSNISGNININNITTFSWDSWTWSACNASCGGWTKTRTVVCRWSDGWVYSDSLCSWGKPSTIDNCNSFSCYTYSWDEGSWWSCDASPSWNTGSWWGCSANPTWNTGSWWGCSVSCWWGTQSRAITCSWTSGTQSRSITCSWTSGTESRAVTCIRSDWNTVIDWFCGWWKPSSSQSCTESCSWTTPSSSQSCTESCNWTAPSSSQSCNNQSCIPDVDCVGNWNTWTCQTVSPYWSHPWCHSWCWHCTWKVRTDTYVITIAKQWNWASCPYSNGTTRSEYCPGTWTCSSFIAWTQVKLEDWTTKNIETIIVWDILKWSNDSKNTVLELKFHPHQWDLYAINGSEYFVTPGHPFMTLDGWKAFDEKLAMQINPTMKIKRLIEWDVLVKENSLEIIQSISRIPTNIQVYNFEVSGTKDYYANWYLVHNK